MFPPSKGVAAVRMGNEGIQTNEDKAVRMGNEGIQTNDDNKEKTEVVTEQNKKVMFAQRLEKR